MSSINPKIYSMTVRIEGIEDSYQELNSPQDQALSTHLESARKVFANKLLMDIRRGSKRAREGYECTKNSDVEIMCEECINTFITPIPWEEMQGFTNEDTKEG